MNVIPEKWKDLYDEWNLRGFLLFSLLLQTLLILFSPMRKRSGSKWLIIPLWSAYLLADSVANFSIGLISNSLGDSLDEKSKKTNSINEDLLAFWAPFLLVHLGGPDTITAFALEDNELWIRHLLSLLFQLAATVYVFLQSLSNKFWIPTLLMFLGGIIKYGERTKSLYLASLDSYRDSMLTDPDPGPNYAKLMDEYSSKKEAKLPTNIRLINEPDRPIKAMNKAKEGKLSEEEIVLYAYSFFKTFRGLIVDLIFSFRERNQSREFFLKRTAEDAFGVVEVELNLMYATLFTKFSVVYKRFGYLGRFISFSAVVATLVLFNKDRKHNIKPVDIAITYTLIGGAMALDIIAALMLLCSDWFKVHIQKLPEVLDGQTQTSENSGARNPFLTPFLLLQRFFTSGNSCARNLSLTHFQRLHRFFTRRWSESVYSFNLIHYCLHPRPRDEEKLIDSIGLTTFLDSVKYVEPISFSDGLRNHIFMELKVKAEMADDLETAKELSAARGDWVLRVERQPDFLKYTVDVDYDQSLLLWHIATELCFSDEIKLGTLETEEKTETEINTANDTVDNYRRFAKVLSDYMLYLLVMQPTMMSAVTGIGQIRFRDTCAEAKKFFNKRQLEEPNRFRVILYFFRGLLKYTVISIIGIILIVLFPALSLIIPLLFIFIYILIFVGRKYSSKSNIRWPNILVNAESFCPKVRKEFYITPSELRDQQIKACKNILDVNTEVDPITVKGDRSKSVLFDGCILAKKLKDLGEEEKWELMSKVWVELLSYAASHCRANAHAQQLSKGGELLTLVWLLIAHFGIGDQFQISEGHSRAKLIVGK